MSYEWNGEKGVELERKHSKLELQAQSVKKKLPDL
jgi:hypothetical protein